MAANDQVDLRAGLVRLQTASEVVLVNPAQIVTITDQSDGSSRVLLVNGLELHLPASVEEVISDVTGGGVVAPFPTATGGTIHVVRDPNHGIARHGTIHAVRDPNRLHVVP